MFCLNFTATPACCDTLAVQGNLSQRLSLLSLVSASDCDSCHRLMDDSVRNTEFPNSMWLYSFDIAALHYKVFVAVLPHLDFDGQWRQLPHPCSPPIFPASRNFKDCAQKDIIIRTWQAILCKIWTLEKDREGLLAIHDYLARCLAERVNILRRLAGTSSPFTPGLITVFSVGARHTAGRSNNKMNTTM